MMIVEMSDSGMNVCDVEIGRRVEQKGICKPRVLLSCMPRPGSGVTDSGTVLARHSSGDGDSPHRMRCIFAYIHALRRSTQPCEETCLSAESHYGKSHLTV